MAMTLAGALEMNQYQYVLSYPWLACVEVIFSLTRIIVTREKLALSE